MSRDRMKEIIDLVKRTPVEDFGFICPGWFFFVSIPGREGSDDELEFHTEILSKTPYHINPTGKDLKKPAGDAADEAAPGNYIYEITKSANNGWLEWIALGRAKNNDVILRHQSVSKLHARIHKEFNGKAGMGEEMWITDMNSSTGTWVNAVMLKPSEPRPLAIGDRVRFGQVDCEFLSGKALHEAMLRIC